MSTVQHTTVLLHEAVQALDPKPGGIYVDVTFGVGGHTRAILDAEPTCKVIALDWDQEALDRAYDTFKEQYGDRLTILWGNFSHLSRLLKKAGIDKVDGILGDFGTSQIQIHTKAGFSFQRDTILDMRMSPAHQKLWAADILNHYSQRDIERVLWEYGDERHGRRIAKAIVEERKQKSFRTTGQLVDLIERVIPVPSGPRRRIHRATKTFQALRIEVNQELANIWSMLKASIQVLNTGGKLVCISFHSLEDRQVKRFLQEHKEFFEAVTKKPMVPSDEEIERNPSSRSAKMRVARRL